MHNIELIAITNKMKVYLEKLVGSIGSADAKLLQQLSKESTEPLECSWKTNLWVDRYQSILCSVNIDCL